MKHEEENDAVRLIAEVIEKPYKNVHAWATLAANKDPEVERTLGLGARNCFSLAQSQAIVDAGGLKIDYADREAEFVEPEGYGPLPDYEELMALIQTEVAYPVSLGEAWEWTDYDSQERVEEILTDHFAEGTDYAISNTGDAIQLTLDCFRQLLSLSGTDKGVFLEKTISRLQSEIEPRSLVIAPSVSEQGQQFAGASAGSLDPAWHDHFPSMDMLAGRVRFILMPPGGEHHNLRIRESVLRERDGAWTASEIICPDPGYDADDGMDVGFHFGGDVLITLPLCGAGRVQADLQDAMRLMRVSAKWNPRTARYIAQATVWPRPSVDTVRPFEIC